MRGPRRTSIRRAHLVVLLVVLMVVGAEGYGVIQKRRRSPFVLWEFRAGMPFEAIEKSAFRQMKGRFTCNAVVPTARLCDLRVTGIPGLVRALVDSRDRVAVIQFYPDSASPVMREESRRVMAEWNLVRSGVAEPRQPFDTITRTTRWSSDDRKWSALARYRRFPNTPDVIRLVDNAALDRLLASSPLAPLVLALDQVVESKEAGNLDAVSDALATIMFRRASDPANESPAPAGPARGLARCEPERIDPIVPSDRAHSGFTQSTDSLFEAAVAAVYPGARVVVGRGVWIVDSTGRSETVHLGRSDVTGETGVAVFALHFPGRSAVAQQRLEDGVPDRYCRSPAQLLFARRNDDGSLAEAHLIEVDQESIASQATSVTLGPPSVVGDPPHIRVRYEAGYAGESWMGSIEWETVIAGDPPRPTVRVPLAFGHRARDAEETIGGYLVVTGRPAGGITLSTLERYDWGASTRTFTIPTDSSGAVLGARLLDRTF